MYYVRTFSSVKAEFSFESCYKMPGQEKEKRVSRRRDSSKRKSVASKKHTERARKAMQLWRSGKYKTLKIAWTHV